MSLMFQGARRVPLGASRRCVLEESNMFRKVFFRWERCGGWLCM
jgi:hypothetical protein